jgi:hypothetical protein
LDVALRYDCCICRFAAISNLMFFLSQFGPLYIRRLFCGISDKVSVFYSRRRSLCTQHLCTRNLCTRYLSILHPVYSSTLGSPASTPLGPLKRAFLTWISEFLTGRLSMSVSHLRPKLALHLSFCRNLALLQRLFRHPGRARPRTL